jgi:hypothetical protein
MESGKDNFRSIEKEGHLFKKMTAALTLMAFIVFSMSCVLYRTARQSVKTVAQKGAGAEIVAIQTKSGKHIEFRKGHPARIQGDSVVGETLKTIEIDRADIQNVKRNKKGKIEKIVTKDGTSYAVVSSVEENEKIVSVTAYSSFSARLSDIQLAWVKRVNVPGSLLTSVGLVIASAVVVTGVLLILFPPSSCPFIYSFDGEQYVFDAEPYGAAVCQGLKRTEWATMDNLKYVNGQYKVLISNELDETQYTDELKLIAVDHPRGVKVVPDTSGRIHTFAQPSPPQKAYDQKGRDILPLIAQNDQTFWVSRVEEKDPEKKDDLRDELILEFPKPERATQAKLLANAWTTMWGSMVAKKFLEVRGSGLSQWYADVNGRGPAYNKVLDWYQNEELYLLKVWVETKDGWKVKAMVNGGGPYVSKDKVYILDVSDVADGILKIKLRPPVNFWMLNYLAVDYSQDGPVRAVELSAATAIDQNGQDVRAKLASMDNDNLVAANWGDRAELTFLAPSRVEGLERTVLLKATGYYNIHLDATGEPEIETIEKMANEPGFTARFALKEYLKWEASLRAQAEKH